MMNFQQFVGSITSESVRKQAYRERKKSGQNEEAVPLLSTDCPPNVAETSLSGLPDGTEESPPSPPKVTDKSLSSPSNIPDKSTSSPSEVADQSTQSDTIVKPLSTDEDSEVTEVAEQPFSYSPIRGKKNYDEIPTFPKGKRLKPPKKPIPKEEVNDKQVPEKT